MKNLSNHNNIMNTPNGTNFGNTETISNPLDMDSNPIHNLPPMSSYTYQTYDAASVEYVLSVTGGPGSTLPPATGPSQVLISGPTTPFSATWVNQINGTQIQNSTISNSKISDVDYSKITNLPTTFPSQISTLNVDSNLAMGTFKITTSRVPTDTTELVSKGYVDTSISSNPLIIPDGSITTAKLADGAVTTPKLATNSVSTTNIIDANVTDAKIVGISASKITGTIATAQIANLAITNAKINDVAANKITGTLTTTQYGDNTITNTKIVSFDYAKLTNVPTTFPSQTSTLTINSDIALALNKINTSATTFASNELVPKNYVDTAISNYIIPDGSVTNTKLVNMNTMTLKGNNAVSSAVPIDLTVSQVKTMLGVNNVVNVDSTNASNITSGTLSSSLFASGSINNNILANMTANTIKGNNTGVSGSPVDLTATQVKTMLALNNVANADTTNASNITSGTLAIARIADSSITDAKIIGLTYSKLTSVPTSFPSLISTLTVDANLAMGAFKITTGHVPTDSTELVSKGYVDTAVASGTGIAPGTVSSVTTTNATLAPNGTNGTYASVKNTITTSSIVFSKNSQSNGTGYDASEVANAGVVSDVYQELFAMHCQDNFRVAWPLQNLFGGVPQDKYYPLFYHFVYAWYSAQNTSDVCMQSVNNRSVQSWYDLKGLGGAGNQATIAKMPNQQPVYGGATTYCIRFQSSLSHQLNAPNMIFTRNATGSFKNSLANATIFCAVKFNTVNPAANQCLYSNDAGFSGPRLALDNRDGSSSNSGSFSFGIFLGSANGYSKLARVSGGTGAVMNVVANRWYCTCLTIGSYQNSGNSYPTSGVDINYPQQQSLYIDGNVVINAARCDGTDANTAGMCIGANSISSGGEYLDGYLRDLIVFNRVLNGPEIALMVQWYREKAYADFNWPGTN